MRTRNEWNVLIIDDEADVHEVTRLALKREKVFGLPIVTHHAHSAKEAMAFLVAHADLARDISVALVDVVMETDEAGLDFCKHVRDELRLNAMQLVLRTGQPGTAPPRQVIDDYGVFNYLLKAEVTADRLYITMKTGIETYLLVRQAMAGAFLADAIRKRAKGPSEVLDAIKSVLRNDEDYHCAIEIGSHYFGFGCFAQKKEYDQIKDKLLAEAQDHFKQEEQKKIPNLIARVGDHIVTQARIVRTGGVATMVLKHAAMPDRLRDIYGPLYRLYLGYLGEMLG